MAHSVPPCDVEHPQTCFEGSFVVTCWFSGRFGQLAEGLLVHSEGPTQNRLVLHLTSTGHGHPHGVSLGAGLDTGIHNISKNEQATSDQISNQTLSAETHRATYMVQVFAIVGGWKCTYKTQESI